MQKVSRATRTTAQVLSQQKRDAEHDTKQSTEKATQSQAVALARPAAIAVPDTRTPVQQYVDEIAPSAIAGRMIRFGKNGDFVITDTEEVVSPDTDFIALCDETLIGWIKFHRDEETPPDRVMGILYDGFVMPSRESLGDSDPAKWPPGLSDRPEDPWQHQICLVLQQSKTHELFTFVTTSRTGRRAVGNLLRHYDRMRKKDDEHYPVIRCKTGGFNHRDERIGWVPTPTFAIVGKAPKASTTVPDTSPSADLNDQIPL